MPRRCLLLASLTLCLLAPAAARADDGVAPYRATASWVDIYDHGLFARPGPVIRAMAGRGVRTLYLETGNFRQRNILAEYQARGELAPVPDDVMSTADIESTFSPASIRLLKFDGKYYGLPTDVQTMLLFYNDGLFTAAGLDPTKDFTTWEEFRQAAIKLTKADGGTMTQAGLDIAASPSGPWDSSCVTACRWPCSPSPS